MTQCSLTRYKPVLKFLKFYFFLVITSPSFLNVILKFDQQYHVMLKFDLQYQRGKARDIFNKKIEVFLAFLL